LNEDSLFDLRHTLSVHRRTDLCLLALAPLLAALSTGCMLDRAGTQISGTDAGARSDAGAGIDAGGDRRDAGDGGFLDAAADAGSDASLPGDDAATPDAGADAGTDAGFDAGTDAGFDAGMDAGFDAGMDAGFDAGSDAGFDAGSDAGFDAGPPTCDDLYGGAVDYLFCASTPTECEFFTTQDRIRTCNSTCEAFGGTCLRRWRDSSSDPCGHRDRTPRSCGTVGNLSDICVCSR